MPDYPYRSGRAEFAPGSSLFLFSDGAFEIDQANGRQWGIDAFVELLTEPRDARKTESRRIFDAVAARTGRPTFEDDFTLVVATFA